MNIIVRNLGSVIVVTLASLFISVGLVSAVTHQSEVDNAVSYLQSQSSNVGNAMALAVAGESVDMSFLKSADTSTAIGLTKPIMALVAAGENPNTYPDSDLVAALLGFYDGIQIGEVSQLNDDAWGLLALASVGLEIGVEAQAAKQYLLDNQNSDGGWSWSVGGDSSTDDTAAVVMALLEAGVSSSDTAITNAITYIKGNQNDDGGFLSNPAWGTDSNSASDGWVIAMANALGQDMSSWAKAGFSPIDHLLTLQDSDGGFWWVTPGASDYNNKMPTADAVIALLGLSYPPAKTELESGVSASIRIEGSMQNICDTSVVAVTALKAVEAAAATCGYTYTIDDTDWGPYLSEIAGDVAAGNTGWMYLVNDSSASVGAADYMLETGDDILWYYGDWGWVPTRLTITNKPDMYAVGDSLLGTVEYYDAGAWNVLEGATVAIGGEIVTTDVSGSFSVSLDTAGVYEVLSETEGYIRSNTETIVVGDAGQEVSLSVEIVQSSGNSGGNDGGSGDMSSIGLSVSPASVSFGSLMPGNTANAQVAITNTGTEDIEVRAEVFGDSIFHFLKITGSVWSSFTQMLGIGENAEIDLSLSIPSVISSYGNKSGSIIFWATQN